MLKDPARIHELQVFSSLGMGPDDPSGATISAFLGEHERRDPSACRRAEAAPMILKRAREFREAAPAGSLAWASFGAPPPAAPPIHH